MDLNEQFVERLLSERFGVCLRKITESCNKSPDFTIMSKEQAIFIAEMKTIEHLSASIQRGWLMPEPDRSIGWASRDDNSVARVATKIHDSFIQLRRYPRPHGIIFLNWDPLVDVKDLEEAYKGQHIYDNADFSLVNIVSKKIAEGRIKEEKDKIDLYIWIDGRDQKIWFRYTGWQGYHLAHTYFLCNTEKFI